MDRIKESFDSLPIAVCFFDKNGVVRLINHRMLAIASQLRKGGIQTLAELHDALRSPPPTVRCLDPQLYIFRFSDGTELRFAEESIKTAAGLTYTQVTAADVTELMWRQKHLQEESAKLAEANERMRRLFEQMPEIIRQEETLAMKLRVHDDIGHSILAVRRALIRQAGLEELRASAALWEQSIAVLYRSNRITASPEPMKVAVRRAAEMGVRVLTEGKPPESRSLCETVSLAIRECAANCARHAGGTELYVRFQPMCGRTDVFLTNNGAAPKEKSRRAAAYPCCVTMWKRQAAEWRYRAYPASRLCSLCRKRRKQRMRVVIVEDQTMVRSLLESYFLAEDGNQIVASIPGAKQAVEVCRASPVDLVLMDVQTEHRENGLVAVRQIKAERPQIKIVVVTSLLDGAVLEEAKSAGADSLWYKDSAKNRLMEVVRRTMAGERVFPDAPPTVEIGMAKSTEFTKTEMKVLRHLLRGLSYTRIAAEMGCEMSTVKFHVANMLQKTGLENKLQLALAVSNTKLVADLSEE